MMTREETEKLTYWINRATAAEQALKAIASLPDEGRGYGDLSVFAARNALTKLEATR